MTWKFEILRCFFVAFGFFELFTNLNYLIKTNGITAARHQHKELPAGIPDSKMKCKVICMLISGILFFTVGILSFILHRELDVLFILTASLFTLYALTEAMYYSYKRTYGFFTISAALLILCII